MSEIEDRALDRLLTMLHNGVYLIATDSPEVTWRATNG